LKERKKDNRTENLSQAISGEFNYEQRVKNIKYKLKCSYISPLIPKYGPVFPRKSLEEEFKSDDFYVLYYGPSGSGKSISITHMLQGRRGSIHYSFRDLQKENIAISFARAVGYFGKETDNNCGINNVMAAFRNACILFKKKYNTVPILVIEDIHTCSIEDFKAIPLALVDINNEGLVNVIYIVSDFESSGPIKDLSGHSWRLEVKRFPDIDENDLKENLLLLSTEQGILQRLLQRTGNSILTEEEVDIIVEKLGTHMGEVIKCIKQYIKNEKKIKLQDIIDRIVKSHQSLLDKIDDGSLFINKVYENDGFTPDYKKIFSFIKQTKEILKEVIEKKVYKFLEVNDENDIIHNSIISKLISKNILSKLNTDEVIFHSKSVYFACITFLKEENKEVKD